MPSHLQIHCLENTIQSWLFVLKDLCGSSFEIFCLFWTNIMDGLLNMCKVESLLDEIGGMQIIKSNQ